MHNPILADILNLIADIAILTVFFGTLLFVILYSSFYHWTKRKAGKSVFFLASSIVVIGLMSSLVTWVGSDYWARPFFRVIGWMYAVFAVAYLLYALVYNWKDRHPIEVHPRDSVKERTDG